MSPNAQMCRQEFLAMLFGTRFVEALGRFHGWRCYYVIIDLDLIPLLNNRRNLIFDLILL